MTTYFSTPAFDRAREFLFSQARPLERELFRYYFEDGTADTVLSELARFQNSDGGFGHGLEPDVRLEASSAIATSIAFQVLRDLGVNAENGMVRRGVAYLLESYDAQVGIWWQVPPAVNDAPHAPWWHWSEASQDAGKYRANPRAELAGYLNDYAELVPEEFLSALTESVAAELETAEGKVEMHDLLCYLRFAATKSLPGAVREKAVAKLKAVVLRQVSGPEKWGGYGLKPLDVAPSPASVVYEEVKELAGQQLEWEMTRQGTDGAWSPPWGWGDSYPEAWAQAEREWKGILTLKFLLATKAYGVLPK